MLYHKGKEEEKDNFHVEEHTKRPLLKLCSYTNIDISQLLNVNSKFYHKIY